MFLAVFLLGAAAASGGRTAAAGASAASVPITLGGVLASHRVDFASFGWEMWNMLNSYLLPGALTDARLVRASQGLAPATIRVGGITGDWLRYTDDDSSAAGAAGAAPGLGSFWPTAPQNFSYANFSSLVSFVRASNYSLMFMLSELYGRDCQQPVPGCPSCDKQWCVGAWDTSNVRAFLQHVHDEKLLQPGDSFELGNELVGHLPAPNTTDDIKRLAVMLDEIWADVPATARPRLYAPSTDACGNPAQLQIMANITGFPRVAGFTFHAYPGQSGEGANALIDILTNATWLRTQIMRGSEAFMCIDAWQAGPQAANLELLVTESSSSWNLPLPPPAQNSFLNGFFTIAELGQCVSAPAAAGGGALSSPPACARASPFHPAALLFAPRRYAATGVSLVARWAFSENSPFGTVIFNETSKQWDAAHDYFILRAHKSVVGPAVLAVSGDEASDVLVYAYCGQARNGSVVIAAANPSLADVDLTFGSVPAAPRAALVFTAPGGNLSSTTPLLNGGEPLRLAADGTPPAMPAAFVAAGDAVTVPARSQAFFVLLAAGLPACM